VTIYTDIIKLGAVVMGVFIELSVLVETPFKTVEEAATKINDTNGVSGSINIKTLKDVFSGKIRDYHIDDYIKDESDDEDDE
jgi:hypothetical protein